MSIYIHRATLNARLNEFIDLFPSMLNKDLAAYFGVPYGSIAALAHELGLHKSREYRRYIATLLARGRPVTEETRARIRQVRTGRRWTIEMRQRASMTHRSRRPKGKRTNRFADARYVEWRLAVLERDAYTCQHCAVRSTARRLHAHHILSWSEYPAERYDITNGLTLCRECHERAHGYHNRPTIPCACGCGGLVRSRDCRLPRARFLKGHNMRVPATHKAISSQRRFGPLSAEHRAKLSAALQGKTFSPEHKARISAALKGRQKPVGSGRKRRP